MMRQLIPLVGLLLGGCASGASSPPVSPAAADWSLVTQFLDSAVAHGAAPGAVLGVSVGGQRFYYSTGQLGQRDSSRPDSTTMYDLASLTKVIGLTTAVMLGVDEGRIELDAPVQRYVPEFAGPGKAAVTIRHLLTHSSGLPAWRPLYQETRSREAAFALVDTTPLDTAPGLRAVYSDLGAILLTQVVETVFGERLDTLLARRVFGPLGMGSTRYLPPAERWPSIAPTERDPWRGRVLRTEVHDENAARLGGVSGHAGLFSNAVDLLAFGEWMLAERRNEGTTERGAFAPGEGDRDSADRTSAVPSFPRSATVRSFTARQDLVPGSSRALGWDTPSDGSSAGTLLSPRSFGHTGFTGTSIWIDPSRDLVIVLLSNRVHPTRDNHRWGPVRRGVADRVVQTLFVR